MLNKLLTLIITLGVVFSGGLFAENLEIIRESTIIYKLKDDATPAQLKRFNALVKKENILSKKEIKAIKVNVVKLKNIKGLEKAFAKQLMETGAVKFAQLDRMVSLGIPNDTYYDGINHSQWHHPVINSPAAWDKTTGDTTVLVAVLDTGVDTTHPDLVDNLILPGHNIPDNNDDVTDIVGHGTGTIGTLGAVGNNGIGVTGVAWNISILPIKISINSDGDSYITHMMNGIIWATNRGAKIVNLSYSGIEDPVINEAAEGLRSKGGLLFMSAGNGGSDSIGDNHTYPDYTSFVAVGATDENNVKAGFSDYGKYIDIVAPGVSILTTYPESLTPEDYLPYVYYGGTSFSSPMAAGLGALIYSVNPDFTPEEVENFIFTRAVDLGVSGDDDMYGHGRIDAGAAVQAAVDYNGAPNELPEATATATPLSGIVPLEVAFDGSASTDDGAITTYSWNFGDGSSGDGMTINHTYTEVGEWNATLTVTDNRLAHTTSAPITIQVSPDPSIINAPSSLGAIIDGNSVTLTWSDNSDNETGFTIERAKKIRGKYNFIALTPSLSPNVTSFIDEVAEVGDYKYRINAFNNVTTSDYSNEVSVKVETVATVDPDPDSTTLEAPALSYDRKEVKLSWVHSCPEGYACSYTLGKTSKDGITFDEVYSGDEKVYSVTETGTYYYKVKVIATQDNSTEYSDSNIVSVRIR